MTRIVSNKRQIERLVELMEENADVAKGICTKPVLTKKWDEIAVELNSLGPPQRDSTKWQRVWADFKCKIKKKVSQNKIELTATGGGPNKLQRLSDAEEAVSRLMHFPACVDPPGIEFGLELTNNISEDNEDDPEEVVRVQSPRPTRTNISWKEKNENQRVVLLENQTSAQEKFYNSMISIMSGVQQNLINLEKSARDIEYYAKKTYNLKKEKSSAVLKIKKEKFELYKQNIKNKENDRKLKLKLKIQLLEIEQAKQKVTMDLDI